MSFSLSPLYKALHTDDRLIPALRRIEAGQRGEVYCVGGCIRDSLLGRPITDVDLAVPGDAMSCARIFADAVKGAFVPLDTEEEVGRVVFLRRMTFDFASFKGQTLYEDLARRDFTINAMACRLSDVLDESSSLIDPQGGSVDLGNKRITAVSEQAFPDDPLRMLRAYRFAAQLGFLIEPNTHVWIARWAKRLPRVSAERIQDELAVLLTQERATPWIREMYGAGVLQAVLPELSGQRPYRLLEHVERFLETPGSCRIPDLERLLSSSQNTARSCSWLLRLAALLAGDQPPRDRSGAWITQIATVRLRLSNREQKTLQSFIRAPVRIQALIETVHDSDDTLYDISRSSGEDTGGVILLAIAMCHTDGGNQSGYVSLLNRLIRIDERRQAVQAAPRLITGNDLMAQFNLPPGPQLGVLLSRLETEQVIGHIRTREEALAAVGSWLDDTNVNRS